MTAERKPADPNPVLYRSGTLARMESEGEGGSARYEVAFSSESPVERWVWLTLDNGEDFMGRVDEVLDHSDGAVDLSFFGSSRAPLLLDHDQRSQIGVIDEARIDGGRLVGRVRFSSSAKAQEVRKDVDEGIRGNVSIGYRVDAWDKSRVNSDRVLRATQWRPMEGSIVSIPADPTVGVGRSADQPISLGRTPARQESTVTTKKKDPTPETPAQDTQMTIPGTRVANDEPANDEPSFEAVRVEAAEAEKARVDAILDEGRRWMKHDLAAEAVRKGTSVERFRGELLMALEAEGQGHKVRAQTSMGLTSREKQRFSLARLIESEGTRGKVEAGFEREVCEEFARNADPNIEVRGVMVPHEAIGLSTRTLAATAGGGTDASALVGTDHLGSEFIDILQEALALNRLGIRVLRNLRGNVQIPKQTGNETAEWLDPEGSAVTASDASFTNVTLQPKDVSVGSGVTRRLVLQSDPSAEDLVRRSIVRRVAQAIDKAGINGSGASGQPTGVVSSAGTTVSISAPPTYAELRDFVRALMASNAGSLPGKGWLVNAAAMDALMGVFYNGTSNDRAVMEMVGEDDFRIIGYRAVVSENVPSNLGVGTNESPILFGAWSELIMGMWGGLDIVVDPYTNSRSGQVNMTVFQTVDFANMHDEAFAVGQAAL